MDGEVALVSAWDTAFGDPPWRRPLVLAAALTDVMGEESVTAEVLARRPLGEVVARYVALAAWLGDAFEAVATCVGCGERLEARLPLDSFNSGPLPHPTPFAVAVDGWRLTARLPTPADMAAAAQATDVDDAERILWERTVLDVVQDPSTEPARRSAAAADAIAWLPETVTDALAEAIAVHDPAGVLRATLVCAGCGAGAEYLVDLGSWCWDAADRRVQQLLADVHQLASAYGWTEDEVLALGPNRRALYLELVS